ncbi:MAG: ABC transporter permease, partial [Xanthomonadales bacterium]|nr:ABC transporter permease [Xanthomonadales bacterium]
MNPAFVIALHDIRHQMRQGATLLWVFVMPPIFFYFIGTVTGGFAGGGASGEATPLVVEAAAPGFLREQIDRRLRDNDFEPEWLDGGIDAAAPVNDAPSRTLSFTANLSDRIVAGESVDARFDTNASALTRDFKAIRINRSLYTVLADVVVGDARSPEALSAADLEALNAEPRIWRLEVRPAGNRQEIPGGFDQAIPGILVMFTLLVLLTSGAALLAIERRQGLLRRLASAPSTRAELVGGKWLGRMALALVQIGAAILVGTLLFRMHWGPDLAM